MKAVDLIGWAASLLLLLTIGKQVHKQWKEKQSQGVSRWLWLGQIAASVGFIAYSLLVGNWVFVFTNAAMLVTTLIGLAIDRNLKRQQSSRSGATTCPS